MAEEEEEVAAAPEPIEEVEMSVLDALKEVRKCKSLLTVVEVEFLFFFAVSQLYALSLFY